MIVKMILTNGFDPDPRVLKESRALVRYGHDVEVLCWDREGRHSKEREIIDGVVIRRFYAKSVYGQGVKQIKGLLNYIFQVKKYLKINSYDVIHAHDFEGALVGSLVKKRNKKLIWDMHELFDGFDYGYVRKIINIALSKYISFKTDCFIYVVPGQREKYTRMMNKKLNILIPNTAELLLFDNLKKKNSDNFRISFIGAVRDYERLKMLIDVGTKFSNIQVNIHGSGVCYENIKIFASKFNNVNVTGFFKYEELAALYSETDLIFALYDDRLENVKFAFPVKVYEAIVTGKPVIVNKGTYVGDFVERENIGYSIGVSKDDLYGVFQSILENDGELKEKEKNIKRLAKKFNWEKTEIDLIKLYENLIN